jgi:hypothetical protein
LNSYPVGLDLAVGEELSSAFEPCLKDISFSSLWQISLDRACPVTISSL